MTAILNTNKYIRLIVEREERFKILDRIKAKLPDVSAKEAEKDITKAIQAVRRRRA